jgi:glycerol-3-phosphate dehydrogenase
MPGSDAAFDLLVVGGGINGTGIARDAAGRGMRVCLAEQGDLAEATSSSSTKLIHGGLRYLEYYDFRLVREALMERERLIRIAPHIIWPLRFVLPHEHTVRPAWMIRAGLFLYDHLGGKRSLPGSEGVRFADSAYGSALKPGIRRGFVYSDAWVEDSRLVVLNARDAADRGASIRTRTRLTGARRQGALWHADLTDVRTAEQRTVTARAVVNAAGPWVGDMLHRRLGVDSGKSARLVKGSHIVVPRLYDGEHAYILQNADRRIVFAIPYEHRFTLIGTTDVPVEKLDGPPRISAEETHYLCDSVNHYFKQPVSPDDVVWSYSGVRPLFDDASKNASAVTRDYVLDIDQPEGEAPVLSVFGGKITTFRVLAEHALKKLVPTIAGAPADWRRAWTRTAPLPGGDIKDAHFDTLLQALRVRAPFLGEAQALRLARAYGTRVWTILGNATCIEDLGQSYGAGLTQAELDYLISEEWAETAEDVLWRRSKLGLHMTAQEKKDFFFEKKKQKTLDCLASALPETLSPES